MTQEEMKEKVIKAEVAVAKRKALLEKQRQKLNKLTSLESVDRYDIVRTKMDIEDCQNKLKDAEETLKNWKTKYDKRISEDEYLEANCPEAIKMFLDKWAERVIAWYEDRYPKFIQFKRDLAKEENDARRECIMNTSEYERYRSMLTGEYSNDASVLHNVWPRKAMDEYLKERNLEWHQIQKRISDFGDTIIFGMYDRSDEERHDWLVKTIEAEKRSKLLDLMERIKGYVGVINDASGLFIGLKGDINGLIKGTEGKATLETIGAGGYNIQCFHFRTLIHPVK